MTRNNQELRGTAGSSERKAREFTKYRLRMAQRVALSGRKESRAASGGDCSFWTRMLQARL